MIVLSNGQKISPDELPNPFLLTDAKNLEWIDKKEAELKAAGASGKGKGKSATKRGRKAAENEDDDDNEDASGSSKKTSSKRRRDDDEEEDASKPAKKSAKTSSSKKSKEPVDLFSISLDGDDDETVAIYDSCNEIRKKINQHLIKSGMTKAQFMRDIARAAYPSHTPNIQAKQLQDFLGKKGPTAGAASRVFYAAYVYFEKKRLSEGKPKSKHRQDMEAQWMGGLPREDRRGGWVLAGHQLVQTKTGVMRSQPRY